jgi:2-(1,2-epoxy-1,2-dihydrophenyl)acetyl-CoA isomerase
MTMAAEETHLFHVEDGVGVVTLNRPEKLNAIHWDMALGLVALLRELRFRDDVRTIVLTGAGRAFCSGGDASWVSGTGGNALPGLADDASRPMPRYQRKTPAGPFAEFTRMIVEVEKPVIAAVNGPAMGAGLAYALACDRRFGDRAKARMCVAMVRLGFSPDCGVTYFLPRLTSLSNALMLVETGKMIDAEEAHRMGLIDELVDEGQALPRALEYAKELANGPSVAIDIGRRCIHKTLTATLDEILDYEAVAATMSACTQDAREGTQALLQKRKATFKGY